MTAGDEIVHYMQMAGQYRQQLAKAQAEAAALRGALRECVPVLVAFSSHLYDEHSNLQAVRRLSETKHQAKAVLATDAGAKLLEAVRVMARQSLTHVEDGQCVHCGMNVENCYYAHQDHEFLSRYNQARTTLRELGVIND